MAVLNLSKTHLSLACVVGGSCAAGVPVALHYTQSTDSQSEKVTENLENLASDNVNSERQSVPARDDISKVSEQLEPRSLSPNTLNLEQESKFSEFWTKITEGYKLKQKDGSARTDNELSFQAELKNILLQEKDLNDEWKLEKEEYKNCSQITAGKADYCGFLKLKLENTEYRFKFDRYGGSRQNNRRWDVTVVKKDKNDGIKWYSKETKKWENSRASNIDQFLGESNSSRNWWITLTGKSIEV